MNGFQDTSIQDRDTPTLKSGVLLKLSWRWVYQWSKVNSQCGIEWDLQLSDRSVSRQPRPCGFFPPTIWGSGAAPCPPHQANLSGNPELHIGFTWWDWVAFRSWSEGLIFFAIVATLAALAMLLKAGEMLIWCWCLAWLCLIGEYLLPESAPLRKYLPKWALWIQTSSGQSEWLRDSAQRKQAVSYHRESHIDRWGGERSWSLRVSLKGSKGSKGSWIFQNVERRNFAVTITVLPLARLRSFRHQCVGMCTKNKTCSWFSRVHMYIYNMNIYIFIIL